MTRDVIQKDLKGIFQLILTSINNQLQNYSSIHRVEEGILSGSHANHILYISRHAPFKVNDVWNSKWHNPKRHMVMLPYKSINPHILYNDVSHVKKMLECGQ